MTERVSNRHEGDLGGLFSPFGDTNRGAITVAVAPGYAALAATQHTAWMLVNLLGRFAGVVDLVSVACPGGVPQAGRVVPFAARGADLRTALIEGGRSIGVVPVEAARRPGPM